MRQSTLVAFAGLLSLAGCGGFTPVDRGDASTTDSAAPGGQGPGRWGALPSGFCCTSDAECRYRKCVDFGGGKMCSDFCYGDESCAGAVGGLRCNTTAKQCEPTAPSLPCRPALEFGYGAKTLGRCCVATHDGWSGRECEGNRCDGFGEETNPFICTHVCSTSADCPGSYRCGATDSVPVCWPLGEPYGCSP